MTLTELLEHIRLATVIEDTNVTDAQITLIINQGIHEIAVSEDWYWLQESTTIDLVDSQQGYTIATEASDFNYAQALVDDDNDTTIPYMAPSTFFFMYGNDTGNEGTEFDFWTIWDGQILLHPIPEDNDSARLTLYYFKDATELSSGGDIPAFDEAFHWILVEYAKWKLYEREEYYDQAERAKITYVQYLFDMQAYYNTQVRRQPFIVGDGLIRRLGDPNIPSLRRI